MKTLFHYEVLSSVLHDETAVSESLAPYQELLERAGGSSRDGDEETDPKPLIYLVLTGGTEALALERLQSREEDQRPAPLLLAAIPDNNSLPACLEILARWRQEGKTGRIVCLGRGGDSDGELQLKEALHLEGVRLALRRSRIGVVGAPSDWLVASSQGFEVVRESWGPELVPVSLQALRQRIGEEIANTDVVKGVLARAEGCEEPTRGELDEATRVHRALAELAEFHRLDALTLRCFELVTGERTTGCLALSLLSDRGLPAGCEGDIPSVVALLWLHLLTGGPSWMANPARIDPRKGEIVLAHCTVPRTMVESYEVRSHFESGLGVALAGRLEPGPVTLVRLGGANLRALWVAEARLVASGREERLCRTQATLQLDPSSAAELLVKPLGNHLVLTRGHIGDSLRSSHGLITGESGQAMGTGSGRNSTP